MNYSDSIKAILLAAINELSKIPENYAVKPGVDFIRNRKLGFKDYMLMFLTMEADCIREELYRFFGRTTDAPSKAAFYRQRKKIREDAFRNLLLAFNRKLPKKLYNGKYEFWACDGSSCDIFLNPTLLIQNTWFIKEFWCDSKNISFFCSNSSGCCSHQSSLTATKYQTMSPFRHKSSQLLCLVIINLIQVCTGSTINAYIHYSLSYICSYTLQTFLYSAGVVIFSTITSPSSAL